MQTVISIFDNRQAARRAVARLIEAGFPRGHVHLLEGAAAANTVAASIPASTTGANVDHDRGVLSSIGHFLASAFGQDPPSGYADRYMKAARRGHSVLVIETNDEESADRTAMILREQGAAEVDGIPESEQSETLRAGTSSSTGAVMGTGPEMQARRVRNESERAMAADQPYEKREREADIEAREAGEARTKPPGK